MSQRKTYDPSPLASTICAGHYCKTDTRAFRRAHGTQDWVLAYTLSGAGRYRSEDKTQPSFLTQPGMLIAVPPGTPHTLDIARGGKFDHLWLHVLMRSHWIEWIDWPLNPMGFRVLLIPAGPVRRAVVGAFRRIVRLTMSTEPDRELFALNALEELLLWCRRIHPATSVSDPRTKAIIMYLEEHLDQAVTIPQLARFSGQSVSRLTHEFRRQMGVSPMQYLEQRRMDRAIELISRNVMNITGIASAVGFENPFYFSLRFRKYTGFSPRAYRALAIKPQTILRRPDTHLNPDDRKLAPRNARLPS